MKMELLIVDDEIYAVKAIRRNIDWQSLGFEAVHEAYSVSEAKTIIEANDIQLMICDIEMPGANGIDLLAWVSERHPAIETIFLTCHSDFDYAKQGLRLGLFEYLLKPIAYDELRRVTEQAVAKLEADRQSRTFNDAYLKYRRLWEEQKPAMLERFWQDLLEERIYSSEEAAQSLESSYGIALAEEDAILPVLIGVEEWRKPLSVKDEEIMSYALRNAADELLLAGGEGCVSRDRAGRCFILFYRPRFEEGELESRCRAFIDACDRFFFCSVSCYIGEAAVLEGLPAAYQALTRRCRDNLTLPQAVIRLDSPEPRADGERRPLPPVDDWRVMLETGKTDELAKRIEAYVEGLSREALLSTELLQMLYHAIADLVYRVLHKQGLSAYSLFRAEESEMARVTSSLPQFRAWASRLVSACGAMIREHGGDHSAVVDKIKRYIEAHAEQEFTREDIAAHVYLNADYVSRMFRKETGQSLQDYIIGRKLDRAKELLSSTNIKISEVGEQVGYTNIPYFTSLFKRMTGVTPLEYRKKYQIQD